MPAGRARAAAAAPGPATAARAREVGAVGGSDPPQRRHNPVGDPGGKAMSAARAGRGRRRWRWAGAHGARAPLALFVCAYEGAWRGGSNLSEGRLCRARKSCSSAIPTMPTQGWETWNQRREIINQVQNKTSSKLRSILATSKLRRALSTQNYKRNSFDLLSPVAGRVIRSSRTEKFTSILQLQGFRVKIRISKIDFQLENQDIKCRMMQHKYN